MDTTVGLDSLAAVNLIRRSAIPTSATPLLGGPPLQGIGVCQSEGRVELSVHLGHFEYPGIEFCVVPDLPVPAVLGKPTLGSYLHASLDLARDRAIIRQGSDWCIIPTIALPVAPASNRPDAQSYWSWLGARMAKAPKRLQTVFQDVMERADDAMLEPFLASFPDWSLARRQASDNDDASIHPAPYQAHLRRPATPPSASVVTSAIACPSVVHAHDILPPLEAADEVMTPEDDHRDFLPPVMSFEEEDKIVAQELTRIVDEAEFSPSGKAALRALLEKHKAAFGMQLRKVNMDNPKVHTYLSGIPDHQPRRPIKNPAIRDAQILWEDAMISRGVVGKLTGPPELARPINLVPQIRKNKLRFAADGRTRNAVTVPDSFPVPSPMEALARMRNNVFFSTCDETDSFWQMPLDEESRVPFYGARGNILEFRVAVQGSRNSPSAQHRLKTDQYAAFAPEELAFLFDDTLLGTPTEDENRHLALLDRFLATCVKHGTVLKAPKVKLGRRRVTHQGFIISHGAYSKDPVAVQPLLDMQPPDHSRRTQVTDGDVRSVPRVYPRLLATGGPAGRHLE